MTSSTVGGKIVFVVVVVVQWWIDSGIQQPGSVGVGR